MLTSINEFKDGSGGGGRESEVGGVPRFICVSVVLIWKVVCLDLEPKIFENYQVLRLFTLNCHEVSGSRREVSPQ